MLMDSVTVLLHRLGVGLLALMHPVLRVRRDADGMLLECESAPRVRRHRERSTESWIHIQLAPPVNRRALAEAVRLLPWWWPTPGRWPWTPPR